MAIPITRVRFTEEQAVPRLQNYILGGLYGGSRVPRGIDSAHIVKFAQENVKPESSPTVYSRLLDVMRFYELRDLLAVMRIGLARTVGHDDARTYSRCLIIVEAFGAVGTQEEVAAGASYLRKVLLPHPSTLRAFDNVCEAAIALTAPAVLQELGQRLAQEIDSIPETSRDTRKQRNRLRAIQVGKLPQHQFVMQAKQRLLQEQPDLRRRELVGTYLDQTPFSTERLEIWAARLLRAEAMRGDPAPVYQEFQHALEAVHPESLAEPHVSLVVRRAAEAILYLQGELSSRHQELYRDAGPAPMSFLWDDPEDVPDATPPVDDQELREDEEEGAAER